MMELFFAKKNRPFAKKFWKIHYLPFYFVYYYGEKKKEITERWWRITAESLQTGNRVKLAVGSQPSVPFKTKEKENFKFKVYFFL